jgi:hypothetical protein
MTNGHEMFHHLERSLRFATKEYTRAPLPMGGTTIPTAMSPIDGSSNVLLGVTPPWLHFDARRLKASHRAGPRYDDETRPVSSTPDKARGSLNSVGGLYRGSFPLRRRP